MGSVLALGGRQAVHKDLLGRHRQPPIHQHHIPQQLLTQQLRIGQPRTGQPPPSPLPKQPPSLSSAPSP